MAVYLLNISVWTWYNTVLFSFSAVHYCHLYIKKTYVACVCMCVTFWCRLFQTTSAVERSQTHLRSTKVNEFTCRNRRIRRALHWPIRTSLTWLLLVFFLCISHSSLVQIWQIYHEHILPLNWFQLILILFIAVFLIFLMTAVTVIRSHLSQSFLSSCVTFQQYRRIL